MPAQRWPRGGHRVSSIQDLKHSENFNGTWDIFRLDEAEPNWNHMAEDSVLSVPNVLSRSSGIFSHTVGATFRSYAPAYVDSQGRSVRGNSRFPITEHVRSTNSRNPGRYNIPTAVKNRNMYVAGVLPANTFYDKVSGINDVFNDYFKEWNR